MISYLGENKCPNLRPTYVFRLVRIRISIFVSYSVEQSLPLILTYSVSSIHSFAGWHDSMDHFVFKICS